MAKVTVVTDSTAYLPGELLQAYAIEVVPLRVILGNESLKDGVDIFPAAFYQRLAASASLPSTSQVTVAEFQQLFEGLRARDQEVLAVLISSQMSGTVASALQAQAELGSTGIEVFDSLSTTLQLGFQVLAGARAARAGASLQQCRAAVEQARVQSGVVFAVDTLEFLHRGGRIGGGKRFLGTMLNIKPILTVHEGRVEALEQARTRRKSINRLVEIVAERTAGKTGLRLGVSHANAPAEAQDLLDLAREQMHPVETLVADLSPAIGTHVGPGTIALAYHYEA